MNLMEASVSSDGRELAIEGVNLPTPEQHVSRLLARREVKFGIRPEHITAGGHSESAVHMVEGTLRFMENMGSEGYVHFSIGEKPLTARVPSDQLNELAHKSRGEKHMFGLRMSACHAFDTDTGLNLFL